MWRTCVGVSVRCALTSPEWCRGAAFVAVVTDLDRRAPVVCASAQRVGYKPSCSHPVGNVVPLAGCVLLSRRPTCSSVRSLGLVCVFQHMNAALQTLACRFSNEVCGLGNTTPHATVPHSFKNEHLSPCTDSSICAVQLHSMHMAHWQLQ